MSIPHESYFVRVLLNQHVYNLQARARAEEPPWEQELLDEVKEKLLATHRGDVSVFLSDSEQPIALAHALGVVAATIGSDSFHDIKILQKGRKCGSCVVSTKHVMEHLDIEHTPDKCLSFWPACEYHYDIRHGTNAKTTADDVAAFFLDALRNNTTIIYSIERSPGKHPFSQQVNIVYEHCVSTYGPLDAKQPPPDWIDLPLLTSQEQIFRLIHLPRL